MNNLICKRRERSTSFESDMHDRPHLSIGGRSRSVLALRAQSELRSMRRARLKFSGRCGCSPALEPDGCALQGRRDSDRACHDAKADRRICQRRQQVLDVLGVPGSGSGFLVQVAKPGGLTEKSTSNLRVPPCA